MDIKQANTHLQESLNMYVVPPKQFNLIELLRGHNAAENEVYLYGAGQMGHIAYQQFTDQGIKVRGFIDKQIRDSNFDLPVPIFTPEEACAKLKSIEKLPIFLTLVIDRIEDYEQIVLYMRQLGFKNIFYSIDYIVQRTMFYQELYDEQLLSENLDSIKKSLSLLEDDKSRDVFCGFIRACITKKFKENIVSSYANEYDPNNTPVSKNWNCFIDAGAFTGDSLEKALEFHSEIKSYIGFEPDWTNYAELISTVKKQSSRIQSVSLYPSAVGNENGMVSFSEEGSVNSRVVKDSKNLAAILRIDDVIKRKEPGDSLLIKMDIEGMELKALHGAENTISLYKPDLMICVYHRISDFWKIPIYLHSILPEYRFNMRCYTAFGGETILYASCK